MGNDNQILNSDPASDKPVTNDDPLILQRRLRKMKYPRIMFTRWNFEECLRECEKILSEETTDDELLSLAADMEFQCRLKLNGLTETVIAGIVKRIEQFFYFTRCLIIIQNRTEFTLFYFLNSMMQKG